MDTAQVERLSDYAGAQITLAAAARIEDPVWRTDLLGVIKAFRACHDLDLDPNKRQALRQRERRRDLETLSEAQGV